MPKMKTHSGAKNEIKVTGSGKYMRRQSGRGHLKLAKGKHVFRRRAARSSWPPATPRSPRSMLGR